MKAGVMTPPPPALFEDSAICTRMVTRKFRGFALYGDPAYPLRVNLLVPYSSANLTDAKSSFIKTNVSSTRVCGKGIS